MHAAAKRSASRANTAAIVRGMRLVAIAFGTLLAFGCSKPDYKIKRDAPTKVEAGDHYSHFFEASTYDQKNGWANCEPDEEHAIDDIGHLSFFPKKAGKIELCIALLYDGEEIDRYAYTVEVSAIPEDPNKKRFQAESKKLAEAMKPKLAKARAATRAIASPEPTACSEDVAKLTDEQRVVYAFPEVEPNWKVSGLKELELYARLEKLSPAELKLMGSADDAAEFDEVKKIATRPYVLLFRHTKIERPKVVGKERFEGGLAEGWAFVVALEEAKVTCITPFSYSPPRLVTYESWNLPGTKEEGKKRLAEHHITAALHENGALAFAKILRQLKPAWSLGGHRE